MIDTSELLRRAGMAPTTFFWLKRRYPEIVRPAARGGRGSWLWEESMVKTVRGLRKRFPRRRLVAAYGRTQTVAQWAAEVGLTTECLYYRIFRSGWEVERALSTPSRKHARPKSDPPGPLVQRDMTTA